MDFTLKAYQSLLNALLESGYQFQTFSGFLEKPLDKTIILRHDVDLLPYNSLTFAKIQYKLGVKGSYYFRAVPESWDEGVIKEIAALGHEVGYHYENLTTCKGNIKEGIKNFETHLAALRKLAEVKTICMHGSPRSRYDNRDIWTKYNYRELGIIGEPYFDINFDDFFYLTDTGRRWDGHRVSIRDKMPQQGQWDREGLTFRSTKDIIKVANQERLPGRIMITVHPQRWSNSLFSWTAELILQNVKNIVKRIIVRKTKNY